MHTYINNNPYSATPHNNRLPFLFRVQHPTASILAYQHKQYKQYKKTR